MLLDHDGFARLHRGPRSFVLDYFTEARSASLATRADRKDCRISKQIDCAIKAAAGGAKDCD